MPSLPLGFSQANDPDSDSDCRQVKRILRDRIGHDPDGAFLKTIVEGHKRGLAVEYEPTIPGAEEWAMKAREEAKACWQDVVRGFGSGTIRRRL